MNQEFWLNLHYLADAYRGEGLTAEERATTILTAFERMPPIARREVLADLAQVAFNLSDLYVTVMARARQLDEQPVSATQKSA